MPFFKKGDLNNPSFRQKRKKNRILTEKSSGKPFSPRLRTTVLKRIARGIESNSVLAEAGIRHKNAAKRWKDMLEDKGNITPLKITCGRPRKVKKHSPEENVLEKLAQNVPYASTAVLACRLLNKSGVDISSRTVRRQLYSRAEERFSFKTPNKSCSEVNLERVIDMQMEYLEGMHQAIDQNLCCPQEFYFADECPIFVGVMPRKGRYKKVHSFMEEFPTVRRSSLFIER